MLGVQIGVRPAWWIQLLNYDNIPHKNLDPENVDEEGQRKNDEKS